MGMRMVSFLIRGVGGFTPLPPGPLPPFRALSGGEITTTESFLFQSINYTNTIALTSSTFVSHDLRCRNTSQSSCSVASYEG